MVDTNTNLAAVENYIQKHPTEIQTLLEKVRQAIRIAAPKAEEKMGYGVPGFYLNGPLVYYAAFKKHIGFYPTPEGIKAFKKELVDYKTAEGTVQFPLDQPMPIALIKKIVKFKVGENVKKGK